MVPHILHRPRRGWQGGGVADEKERGEAPPKAEDLAPKDCLKMGDKSSSRLAVRHAVAVQTEQADGEFVLARAGASPSRRGEVARRRLGVPRAEDAQGRPRRALSGVALPRASDLHDNRGRPASGSGAGVAGVWLSLSDARAD